MSSVILCVLSVPMPYCTSAAVTSVENLRKPEETTYRTSRVFYSVYLPRGRGGNPKKLNFDGGKKTFFLKFVYQ